MTVGAAIGTASQDVISFSADIAACEKLIKLSAAISACEKRWQCDQALALFDKMGEGGMIANVICHRAAISSCEKGEQALPFFHNMRKTGMTADVISLRATTSECDECQTVEASIDDAYADAQKRYDCQCYQLQCGHLSARG